MNHAQLDVELCGRLADACGPSLRLTIPENGLPVTAMLASLACAYPAVSEALGRIRIKACINETIVSEEAVVRPGDTVALFPPVSGG
jgi:molybdopterin synthase sulfur carrier subunit